MKVLATLWTAHKPFCAFVCVSLILLVIFGAQYLTQEIANNNESVDVNIAKHIENDTLYVGTTVGNEHEHKVDLKATNASLFKYMIPRGVPSMVIVGFPKCGTSSLKMNLQQFDDLQFFGGERHYWKECWPLDSNGHIWQADDWKLWINQFIHGDGNLSSIANFCVRDRKDAYDIKNSNITDITNGKVGCTIDDYANAYFDDKRMKQSGAKEQNCIHLKLSSGGIKFNSIDIDDNDNDNDNNNNNYDELSPYCWYYEKGSNVRQAFMIAPIFANKLPHTKTLMIVREPLKQLISYVTLDIDTIILKKEKPQELNSDYLSEYLWNFYQKHKSFGYIQQQAGLLLNKWIYLQKTEKNNRVRNMNHNNNNNNNSNNLNNSNCNCNNGSSLQFDYLLDSNATKDFLKIYLYEAVIKSDIFIGVDSSSRHKKAFTTSLYFVSLIFYLYSYDQVFGYKNWNQFRVIQFEWLYGTNEITGDSNMFNALSSIKCWLQTNKEIINNNYNNNPFENCPIIFGNNRNYYNKKKNILDNLSRTKVNSKTHTSLTDEYENKFEQFYYPIKQLFLLLLNHRKEILLGEWKPWQGENKSNIYGN